MKIGPSDKELIAADRKEFNDSGLLALLAEDSQVAFQLIFDRYHPLVYRVAHLYLKSPFAAEDIVQEVFLKIWVQRKDLSAISSLNAWLYTLTRNYTLNHLKKVACEWTARKNWAGNNKPSSGNHEPSENTADHKIRSEQYTKLYREALEKLPSQQQRVFLLARENDLSYEAIASQLSLSVFTVKTHMARALAFIRAYLQQHNQEFFLLLIIGEIFF
ncbi:RNA polymerase sigma-70 factor [Flavitalea flava]